MDIRYSPYQLPFVPSEPKGVYWIGAELRDAPHSAHVWVFNHHVAQEAARHHQSPEHGHIRAVEISAEESGRPFLSVCGCTWCLAAARKMISAPVAVPVTPPLSLMGETLLPKMVVF